MGKFAGGQVRRRNRKRHRWSWEIEAEGECCYRLWNAVFLPCARQYHMKHSFFIVLSLITGVATLLGHEKSSECPKKGWVCNGIFFLLLIGQYPFSQLRKTSQDIWQGITMSLKARRMPHESAMRGTAHEDFLHYVYWPKISSKPLNNEKGRHSILMMSFMMKTISVVC